MESKRSPYLKHIYVCVNRRDPGETFCAAGGSEEILEKLKAYVKANGLKGRARVSKSGCMDLCAQGPNVMVYPDHQWYHHVTLADADRIIAEHLEPLVQNEIASRFAGARGRNDEGVPSSRDGIGAFLFDLGNVLVRFDHLNAARQIAQRTRVDPEELFRLFFDSPLVIDHDTGKISTRAFYEELRKKWNIGATFEEFLLAWNGIFTEDKGSTALVRKLMKRYPCYLISNTNPPHFEHCRESYPVLKEFSGWILSYEVGVLKPHPAIYQKALEMIGLPPERIFYVDDRADLIEAAETMGFMTHRFTDAKTLREELSTKGV